MTSYLVDETTDAAAVAGDGVIVQPTLHNASQPPARFTKWSMLSPAQLLLDCLQRRTHTACYRVTRDGEPAMLSGPGTLVRETQEVESIRPVLASLFSPFVRKTSELDQTSLSFVQFLSSSEAMPSGRWRPSDLGIQTLREGLAR